MIVKLDRGLKIRLLVALRDGYLNTLHFPELYRDDENQGLDLSFLSEEEQRILLKVSEKALNEMSGK